MDEQEQHNHERDLTIAKNEATREMSSNIRVSTWAVIAAVVVGLAGLMFYLLTKTN